MKIISSGAFSCAVFGLTLQASAQTAFHYTYFKQARPLTLNTSQIAVFAPSAQRAPGVPAAPELSIPGVFLRQLSENSESSVRSAMQAAARADQNSDFVSPVFIGADGGPLIVTRRLLVGFDPATPPSRCRELLAPYGEIVDEAFADTTGLYLVESPSRDGFEVLDAANTLAKRPEIRYAEPDMIFSGHADTAPNDPLYYSQWALSNTGYWSGSIPGQDMRAEHAWTISTGSPSIIDVIIDVGVDPAHPDLHQIFPGIDTTSQASAGGQGQPMNACDKHGTAVAGCVSAIRNNALGVAGLAPDVRTVSARTFISNLSCSGGWSSQASWTVASLAFAESIGARVTNNSNGYGFTSSTISDKYTSTRAAGMVHFASAGNSGAGSIGYPASISSVNAIAALDVNGSRAGFSQYGAGLDFSAPGVNILSTDITGSGGYTSAAPYADYATVSGTSFASPLSSAVAALVISFKPSLSSTQVERAMQQGARDIYAPGYDTNSGWGFVDAFRSLERIRCPSDLNFDELVDDADFTPFVVSYNLLDCADPAMPAACSADLNGDGLVDDADFSLFVAAYDALLCP
ncbi:MAG: S8 family serine peptidase [Phycisphaerales bacterium]|nr:S8 family serine peptidase [Planctomycetota bacterium]